MKRMLFLLLVCVMVACCPDRDHDPDRLAQASYRVFVYEDQTQGQFKFGVKISHTGKVEQVDLRLEHLGRIYYSADFTWRYGRGETEGIVRSVYLRDRSYPRVLQMRVRIDGVWRELAP